MLNSLDQPTSDDKLWAGLSYACSIFCTFGIPALILYFIKREDSSFVRFHAMQAFSFGLIWFVCFILALLLGYVPTFGIPLSVMVIIVPPIYWIYLIIQAFRGKKSRIPLLGAWIQNWQAD